jgi:hypothetical protein
MIFISKFIKKRKPEENIGNVDDSNRRFIEETGKRTNLSQVLIWLFFIQCCGFGGTRI